MEDSIAAASFTALGWILGFLSRLLESRWKGGTSLRGALRACADDHRAISTHAFFSDGQPSAAELKSASEQLLDDAIRLREVLIGNPRFGKTFWGLYRRFRHAATQLMAGNVPSDEDWSGMRSLAVTLSRRNTWWFFLPFADRRSAHAQKRMG